MFIGAADSLTHISLSVKMAVNLESSTLTSGSDTHVMAPEGSLAFTAGLGRKAYGGLCPGRSGKTEVFRAVY